MIVLTTNCEPTGRLNIICLLDYLYHLSAMSFVRDIAVELHACLGDNKESDAEMVQSMKLVNQKTWMQVAQLVQDTLDARFEDGMTIITAYHLHVETVVS